LQQGGQPSAEQAQLVISAISGIDDKDALDSEELENIATATAAYNNVIQGLAQANGLVYVDAMDLLNRLADEGIPYDAGVLTSEFVTGGAFSLDGVHPTPRGYAAVANRIIEGINATYNSTVPKVNIGNYKTFTLSNEVQ